MDQKNRIIGYCKAAAEWLLACALILVWLGCDSLTNWLFS